MMNNYRRWRLAILAAFFLVVLAAAWVALSPIQLGGQAAYIIIDGISMEPRFNLGDLVIVRKAQIYQVGDIVAYNNIPLKRYVFHRIIDIKSNHYVLKGDNNDWNDSYQPVQSDLVGKFWLNLPQVGGWVRWARLPQNMGLLAGIAGCFFTIAIFTGRRRNGIKMNRKSIGDWFNKLRGQGFRQFLARLDQSRFLKYIRPGVSTQQYPSNPDRKMDIKQMGGILEGSFFAISALFFVSLILGYFAFTRPTQRSVSDDINFHHIGMFSYSAIAPAGVYDSNSVHAGDPIFPKLTCTVNFRFSYALAGVQPEVLIGKYQLFAKILDEQSGWQRTIPLTPQTAFSMDSFVVSAPLDLCQVEALVASVEQATDLHPPYYTLSVTPVVTLSGKVSGHELEDTFEPALVFRFDKIVFSVVNTDPQTNPLNPSQEGTIKNSRLQANTLPILGTEYEVGKLRMISLAGLLASLIGIAILASFFSSLARQGQEAMLQIKYGPLLVGARDRNLEAASEIIDVANMDDLARLAERNNSMILYQSRNRINSYTVRDDRITYRYAITEGSDVSSPTSLVVLEDDLQRGMDQGEFEVYYQPILSLADGKIFGVEAFLRWQHPKRGLIPAAEFIPAAEATGLIDPLGDWLLGVACAQLKNWQSEGLSLTLSINLSGHQLKGDLSSSILRILENTGVDPHALQIEIPETRIMEGLQNVIPKLQRLKDRGVQISMDDSTGESVLSPLPQFPMTSIKLERQVIERIIDQEKAINVRRMIEAARDLGLKVSAVGVETQEQLDILRSQYCNFVQGYLLGRPAPAREITRSLLEGRNAESQKQTSQLSIHKKDSR